VLQLLFAMELFQEQLNQVQHELILPNEADANL